MQTQMIKYHKDPVLIKNFWIVKLEGSRNMKAFTTKESALEYLRKFEGAPQ